MIVFLINFCILEKKNRIYLCMMYEIEKKLNEMYVINFMVKLFQDYVFYNKYNLLEYNFMYKM